MQERVPLAKHWHQWRATLRADLNSDVERWVAPSDCDDIGDEAVAELILAVEHFRAPDTSESPASSASKAAESTVTLTDPLMPSAPLIQWNSGLELPLSLH
jgi:hypothetical protein